MSDPGRVNHLYKEHWKRLECSSGMMTFYRLTESKG